MKMAVFMDNSLPNLILSTKRGTFMDRCLQTMHLRSFKELDRTRPSAFCRYLYRTVPNISHFTAFSGLSFTKKLEKLPDGSDQATEHVKKIREGLLYAGFVVYYNRTVGSEGSHLQGHHHTVVMMRGVFATLQETWERDLIA